jgi:hypothetical protein
MAKADPTYRLSVRYAGTPNTVIVPPAGKSEFERFEDLTRKLAQVPKSELDEKRKKA